MEEVENPLEDILKKHYQKNVQFLINGEEFKAGKFLLYRLTTYANNYYVEFHIKREKKIDIIKIPYPFTVEHHEVDNLLYFDYRIVTLCKKNKEMVAKLNNVCQNYPERMQSKFFERILEIQFT